MKRKNFKNAKQIVKFERDFVINTDQTGCEYCADVRRILSDKGEKTTEVFFGDFNKITHSYTAQYTITASGKFCHKYFCACRNRRERLVLVSRRRSRKYRKWQCTCYRLKFGKIDESPLW